MKTRFLLALLFGLSFFHTLFSQQFTEAVFGDSGWNAPHKIWQMPDGNIALVSSTSVGWLPKTKLYPLSLSGDVVAEYDLPDALSGGALEATIDRGE